jgi:gluconate kinase
LPPCQAGVSSIAKDRRPWLESIRTYAQRVSKDPKDDILVIACSALKKAYRQLLRDTPEDVYFMYRRSSSS